MLVLWIIFCKLIFDVYTLQVSFMDSILQVNL